MRIATYNLWNSAPTWPTRLEAICEELGRINADVVALQEVPSRVSVTDSRDTATYLAERLSYPHFAFRAYPDDPEEGLAFLSKFPLAFIECGWETDITALHDCGMRTRVNAIGTPIAVTNLHLNWKSIATREAQIVAITEWIASRTENGCHELLCGDFNSGPASSIHGFLTGQRTLAEHDTLPWHDLAATYAYRTAQLAPPTLDFATNPRWKDEPTLSLPVRMDWILIQDRWPEPALKLQHASLFGHEPTTGTGVVPSDHYGVLVDLE